MRRVDGTMTQRLEPEHLDAGQCVALLAIHPLGRWCVVHDGQPMAVPVNYRVVEIDGALSVIVRTAVGSLVDVPGQRVALEIDSYDHANERGWSVLATGVATDVTGLFDDEGPADPHPYLAGKDRWLRLRLDAITGRRVVGPPDTWAFAIQGYL
jgi:hypothetical protein